MFENNIVNHVGNPIRCTLSKMPATCIYNEIILDHPLEQSTASLIDCSGYYGLRRNAQAEG